MNLDDTHTHANRRRKQNFEMEKCERDRTIVIRRVCDDDERGSETEQKGTNKIKDFAWSVGVTAVRIQIAVTPYRVCLQCNISQFGGEWCSDGMQLKRA